MVAHRILVSDWVTLRPASVPEDISCGSIRVCNSGSAARSRCGHRQAVVSLVSPAGPDLVWALIDASGRWHDWLEVEPEAELVQINEAVRDVLRAETGLVETVAGYVAQPIPDRVLFLTDAGLVHPYFRLRSLESGLHDRVQVPTVIFYPGRRSGQYGLHFLGFYSVDGNYRSTLLGGQP